MDNERTERLSAVQGVLLAITVEKRGHGFYQQAAAATEDPKGRAMFARLAQDEVRHLEWLEAHKSSLEKTGQWEDVALTGEALSLGKRVFPESSPPGARVEGKTREMEALRRGMQAEKDSVSLYSELAARTTDPRGKGTFERLAQEEEGHYQLLQAELAYLGRSGFFFETPEFSLEDLE